MKRKAIYHGLMTMVVGSLFCAFQELCNYKTEPSFIAKFKAELRR